LAITQELQDIHLKKSACVKKSLPLNDGVAKLHTVQILFKNSFYFNFLPGKRESGHQFTFAKNPTDLVSML